MPYRVVVLPVMAPAFVTTMAMAVMVMMVVMVIRCCDGRRPECGEYSCGKKAGRSRTDEVTAVHWVLLSR